jgi:hypothetical protein
MFSQKDIIQIQQHGLTIEQLNAQIQLFKSGFSYLKVARPATAGDGIMQIDAAAIATFLQNFSQRTRGKKLLKFVPASGAATRMFKSLFEFQTGSDSNKVAEEMATFISGVKKFAFYPDLLEIFRTQGLDMDKLLMDNDIKSIIHYLLDKDGLNYGSFPKGLLKFHAYTGASRTPVEEHMVEGALYAKTEDNKVFLHFTVSPEHMQGFNKLVSTIVENYEKHYHCKFHISYSIQKPSTDTIAVDINNSPFREADGTLVFRPGGHGALLENLNELDADLIYIKNIDNVAPDRLKENTVNYKKALAAILLQTQKQCFDYVRQLETSSYGAADLATIKTFIEKNLGYFFPDNYNHHDDSGKKVALLKILNRPIRVCGMVKNQGEPGGGPFWVQGIDGSCSLQILESSQFDFNDETQKEIFKKSTHFNPVDLVLAPKDPQGRKIDLIHYRDPDTGFISIKSKDGKELKALELPGLWNGAMAYWNTIFVEVPLETFTPVKTVLDLIRKEHIA